MNLVMFMIKGKVAVVVVAIVCITLLEVVALLKGIDGQLFASVIAGITALVGYLFGQMTQKS